LDRIPSTAEGLDQQNTRIVHTFLFSARAEVGGGVDPTRSIRAWENANCLGSRTLDLRQFVDVPVPSEGLDQQNTRIELAPSDIDVILFVAKSSRL
jgi:hypothetical protein